MPGRASLAGEALEEVNLLELAPVRVVAWEESEECVVIVRPRPSRRGLARLWQWVSFLMSAKRIRLDEVSTFAWLKLDGAHTVGDLAGEMRERFGERVEPAEERLGLLVRALRGEGFLAYPGWDETEIGQ